MEISWLFSLIFFLLIPIFIILRSLKPIKKQNLPPGPRKLPIIGNLHQLASKKTPPHHLLQELSGIYGPIMHLRLGEIPTVVISSPDLAKLVMRAHDANFATRPQLMMGKELYYDYSDMGLAPYGEYWRQVRKIATLELFTARRVQVFRDMREEEATSFVKSIASEAAQGGLVNLSERVFGLIFDLTSRTVFNEKGKDQAAFRTLTTLMSKVSSGFAIADLFPSIKLLHSIDGMKKKVKEMVEESNRILDPIIQLHKYKMKEGKVHQEEDLVDVLLKFHKDDPDDSEFSLTTNNIKAIILAEEALSQGMEALQQSLAKTLANGIAGSTGSSGNVANYMGQMAMAMGKLGTLEGFLRQVLIF
ncbi:hypothetical protein BVRB_8g196110 [Beta vulgaris subsp. vulgaris]|nr:hypothetical protein BVRB_8g196110 [Beta vulgaris subsp. vulgaris]